ncbi:MAG: glycosyltransferase family 2 protein [Nitrososphaeria archaeon]
MSKNNITFEKKEIMPLVSIIITSYNYGRYLSEAIESILNQIYPNVEIIVVDDGSEDNTRDVARCYPVRYIYQDNQGISAARNNGIKLSHGEYFICLDADDKLLPSYVAKTVNLIVKDLKVGFVVTGSIFWNEKRNFKTIWIPDRIYGKYSLHVGWKGALGCALFRRTAFDSLEYGYDGSLPAYEDLDICYRLLLKGWRAKTIFEPLHLYRVHVNSLSPKNAFQKDYVENIICNKYQFRRTCRKLYALYENTFGRIAKLMNHPAGYLKGIREKIALEILLESISRTEQSPEEMQEIVHEIYLNIYFLVKCYRNKYLRNHYTKQISLLKNDLLKILKK